MQWGEGMINQTDSFDFEYWRKLASTDPKAFEKKRLDFLERLIADLPCEERKKRMRSLQWRVDMERRRAKNPVDSTLRIYRMMWDSVTRNQDELQKLISMLEGKPEKKSKIVDEEQKGNVLQFRKKDQSFGRLN